MKEAARATAAATCLPSRGELADGYAQLKARIDRIANQAEAEGSLKIALSGLNSIRQTLDSLSRLAGSEEADVNGAIHTQINFELLFQRIIQRFDDDAVMKERLAQALLEADDEFAA